MRLLLDTKCEAIENFKALMALNNLASQNVSMKKRIPKDHKLITKFITKWSTLIYNIAMDAVKTVTMTSGEKKEIDVKLAVIINT